MATPIATPPALRMLASSSVIIRNSATAIASFDEGSVSSFSTDVPIFMSPREERLDTASGLGKKACDDAAQSTNRAKAVRITICAVRSAAAAADKLQRQRPTVGQRHFST